MVRHQTSASRYPYMIRDVFSDVGIVMRASSNEWRHNLEWELGIANIELSRPRSISGKLEGRQLSKGLIYISREIQVRQIGY